VNGEEGRAASAVAETVPAVHASAYCPAQLALAMLGRLVVGRQFSPGAARAVRMPPAGQGWRTFRAHAASAWMVA
jgi:hypothetical protein